MGNSVSSNSKGHHEDTVDFGSLTPQGVYTGPRDWNHAIVTQLICERKLAPFYRPLEDYEDNWDDEQILAARRELPEAEVVSPDHESSHSSTGSKHSHSLSKRASVPLKEDVRCPEAAIYRGAVECPICFLYYPPNINHSRCCDQAICTECFLQIKRADPTTTHIVSEPAACPYCVQDEFGVHYIPPPWRAGIGSDGSLSPQWLDSPKGSQSSDIVRPTHKRRQKSVGADSPDVVTTDRIRPDWEQKLAAVRAAVARRANRRIIMRQVGDRLIPVGVTSGRVHALTAEEASQAQAEVEQGQGGSRRSRRNRQNPDLNQLLGQMGLAGQDVEELMMMEAMRLSLLEHEEHQRREAAKGEQNGEAASSTVGQTASAGSAPPTGSHTPSAPPADGSASPSTPSTAPATAPRTPSQAPTPPNSEAASSDFQRRQLNPPPFSTIAAAMSAANAATAILSNRDSTGTPNPATPPPASTAAAGPVAIPAAPASARPNLPPPSMSFASSVFSTESNEQTAGSTYDVLDSDMDAGLAREPLLGSGPPTPTEAAPEAASSFDESLT